MYGPLTLKMGRIQNYMDLDGLKRKRVCSFSFTIDNHICRPERCEVKFGKQDTLRDMKKRGEKNWANCEVDCCDPSSLAVHRVTSSFQNPEEQEEGHNFQAWYLSSLPIVQEATGVVSAMYVSKLQAKCHTDKMKKYCAARKQKKNRTEFS